MNKHRENSEMTNISERVLQFLPGDLWIEIWDMQSIRQED